MGAAVHAGVWAHLNNIMEMIDIQRKVLEDQEEQINEAQRKRQEDTRVQAEVQRQLQLLMMQQNTSAPYHADSEPPIMNAGQGMRLPHDSDGDAPMDP